MISRLLGVQGMSTKSSCCGGLTAASSSLIVRTMWCVRGWMRMGKSIGVLMMWGSQKWSNDTESKGPLVVSKCWKLAGLTQIVVPSTCPFWHTMPCGSFWFALKRSMCPSTEFVFKDVILLEFNWKYASVLRCRDLWPCFVQILSKLADTQVLKFKWRKQEFCNWMESRWVLSEHRIRHWKFNQRQAMYDDRIVILSYFFTFAWTLLFPKNCCHKISQWGGTLVGLVLCKGLRKQSNASMNIGRVGCWLFIINLKIHILSTPISHWFNHINLEHSINAYQK